MSYISQHNRFSLDPVVDNLVNVLRELESDNLDGTNDYAANLQYIIARLAKQASCKPLEIVGLLDASKQLFYRKHIVPKENQQEFDNGSIGS